MIEQKELNFENGNMTDFLSLPATELLEEFGKGSHIPGSGCAAALSALLGIEMMKTVCKLTLQKPQYGKEHTQIQIVLEQLEKKCKPEILRLFNQDIEVFHRVSTYRIARDKAKNTKNHEEFRRKALDELRIATEIPIQICQICFELIEIAISIFDKGFKSARGDSGVAISNLLSAICGGLFVIFLNLNSFYKSKWLDETRKRAEELMRRYNKFQVVAFEKVLELYESLDDADKQLKLEFFGDE